MAGTLSIKDVWNDAFGKETSTYRVQIGERKEVNHYIASEPSGSDSWTGVVAIPADSYEMRTIDDGGQAVSVTVSKAYRGMMPAGSEVRLVEKLKRFFWAPFPTYRLVLGDGTEINVLDINLSEHSEKP